MLDPEITIPGNQTISHHIGVVTVSFGSGDVLGPFLSTLVEASTRTLEIVVADNKPSVSLDEVQRLAREFGARYLPLPSNLGYGHAINAAVELLSPEIDWILISNPDVTLSPGAIDALLATAQSDSLVAAVGPRILSSNGDTYPSARTIPSLRSGVGHALFSNLWPSNPWTRRYRSETPAMPLQRDAGWLSGACLLIRRTVFLELQGFDESYFMYFEDVDLGYRIGKLGLRNVYEPAAVVVHTGAHSTQENAGQMIRAHHDSAVKFLSKKYSGWARWPLRVALGVGLGLRSHLEGTRNTKR